MWKLSLRIDERQLNALDDLLCSIDADSISYELFNNNYETSSNIVLVSAIFDESCSFSSVLEDLTLLVPNSSIMKYDKILNQNWHLRWKSAIKPIVYNFGLAIIPTWWNSSPKSDFIIKLDPGQAFGTGSHETTYLCLKGIFDLRGREKGVILDFGCGTGILGIAAHLIGFNKVFNVDDDPIALEIAEKNRIINKINKENFHVLPPKDFEEHFFDVIVANICLNTLLDSRMLFARWIRPGGLILLSGILNSQVQDLLSEYGSPFNLVSIKKMNDWSLVILEGK